jgi:NAD(P)H dehydrogenase (quinone)
MSKVLLVLAHPRRDSLTGQAADAFAMKIEAHGHEVEFADLVSEGFDPTLREEDEPEWGPSMKTYSAEVQREMARISRNDATVIIFPVWWWSMPAILKGWIDRVWNDGFAYGGRFYPHDRVWMIGLAGNSKQAFAKRGYDSAMQIQIDMGILQYCQVKERRLELLHGAIEGIDEPLRILEQVRSLAANF